MNERFITGIQHLNVKNLLLWQEGKVIYEEHRDEDCYRNGYSATKTLRRRRSASPGTKALFPLMNTLSTASEKNCRLMFPKNWKPCS